MVVIKANPTSKKVQRDQERFARLIGECITTWAFVDRQLFYLFRTAIELPTKRAAIVYYKWRSLGDRLSLADFLLKHELRGDSFEKKWRPLRNNISNLLKTRSIIAHHPPKRTGTSRNGRAIYLFSIHAEPAERLLEKKLQGLGNKDEIDAADLLKHLRRVEGLVRKLAVFRNFFERIKARERKSRKTT